MVDMPPSFLNALEDIDFRAEPGRGVEGVTQDFVCRVPMPIPVISKKPLDRARAAVRVLAPVLGLICPSNALPNYPQAKFEGMKLCQRRHITQKTRARFRASADTGIQPIE